jgi:hypothetical protein
MIDVYKVIINFTDGKFLYEMAMQSIAIGLLVAVIETDKKTIREEGPKNLHSKGLFPRGMKGDSQHFRAQRILMSRDRALRDYSLMGILQVGNILF